jgi:radical SAM protein with 4Fe4S-binding SPASM domain
MDLKRLWRPSKSSRAAAVEPGLYHYLCEADGATARFHLRVDPRGGGILAANAAAMARLNPSGVLMAKALLDGEPPDAIVGRVMRAFHGVNRGQVFADLDAVRAMIERMARPGDGYPIINLADPALGPKGLPLDRPMAADLTLCAPFHVGRILDRLWNLAIPHVTLVAASGCDWEHLRRAVVRAGDLGLICGARGMGSDLAQDKRIAELAAAGLDHLDVYCFSLDENIHDSLTRKGDFKQTVRALAAAREADICAVAQLGLVRAALPTLDATLEGLARHGVRNAAAFALATIVPAEAQAGSLMADELPAAAAMLEESAERHGLRLFWQPSVRRNPAVPLGEQLCQGPRTGGDWSIRLEPDGTVYPARGPRKSAGNLLEDDWETIEQSEVFAAYRRRLESDTRCGLCPGLAVCAADCPRHPAGWADDSG